MDPSGNRVLCSVDHAHMHFVPLPASLTIRASEGARADWEPVDGGLATIRRLSAGGEYSVCKGPGRPLLAARLAAAAPRIAVPVRRVLAAGVGRTESWNWREVPDARAAHETWRCFVHG